MRIAYCIKSLHQTGGMERVITAKANYLAMQGYEVFILTTDQQGRSPFFDLDSSIELYDLGVNYDRIDTSSRWRKYRDIMRFKRKHRQALETKLNEIRPDITISTGYHEFSFLPHLKDGSLKLIENHGSWGKTVSEHRFSPTNYFRRILAKWSELAFTRRASRYACVVLLTKEDALLWGNRLKHVKIIHNLMPIRSDRVSDCSSKRCIVVARLAHEKNLKDTLDIWARVARTHPDWRLDIYGEGYLQGQLEEQIQALEIGDSCLLHKPTSKISEAYLDSSILLMTSQTEGLPMVLLEAQELGLASVCYAFHCGAKDVLVDASAPCGYVVPYGDKEAFAEQLIRLMEDKSLRTQLGKNARENAARFYPEVILPQWDHLFRSLVSSKNS